MRKKSPSDHPDPILHYKGTKDNLLLTRILCEIKVSLHDGRDISKEHTLQIAVKLVTLNFALKVKLL